MRLPKHVVVRDVGPRDGLQNEAVELSLAVKTQLVDDLTDAGATEIEAGSFVSERWVPRMADSAEVFNSVRRDDGVRLFALVPNDRGYDRALAAGAGGVVLVAGASDTFQRKNLNKSLEQSLTDAIDLARRARADGLVSSLAVSTSWGCPFEGHVDAAVPVDLARRAIDAGVDQVSFADTTGMADPLQVARMLDLAGQAGIPREQTACHFHNTRGTGLANVLAALEQDVTHFDSSIGGLGGCPFAPKATGNICTEDLVHMLHAMGVHTGINLARLIEASLRLESVIGRPLPGAVTKAGPAFAELSSF